ncbi:MAG TPA: DNA/RNA non-specific endonuclease [Paucimonas sp.]|nr:DNA/RNA non-specific endonuclease [Paucimonas sp.]
MRRLYAAGAMLAFLAAACTGREPVCNEHFADGTPPAIVSPSLGKKTQMLCFEGYAVMHSGVSRTPIWAAEHLTATSVRSADELKHKNSFHAEERLPAAERAELRDYARSGFDRGHMAPAGDMGTENAQYESFSLANMIPQHPNNNQGLWAGIEESVRRLARQSGELFVVTGPVFEGTSLQRLNGRVLVPTSVFKAIYDPARRQAAAYVTPNAEGMEYWTMSIAELEEFARIDPFPRLPAEIRETKMTLPVPELHKSRKSKNRPVEVGPTAPETKGKP